MQILFIPSQRSKSKKTSTLWSIIKGGGSRSGNQNSIKIRIFLLKTPLIKFKNRKVSEDPNPAGGSGKIQSNCEIKWEDRSEDWDGDPRSWENQSNSKIKWEDPGPAREARREKLWGHFTQTLHKTWLLLHF